MKMYDLPVLITQDEAGFFCAVIPIIPGCYSQGNTRGEALAHVTEAAKLCLECQEREGWTIPEKYYLEHITVGVECQKFPESREKSVSLHCKDLATK